MLYMSFIVITVVEDMWEKLGKCLGNDLMGIEPIQNRTAPLVQVSVDTLMVLSEWAWPVASTTTFDATAVFRKLCVTGDQGFCVTFGQFDRTL